MRSRGTESIAFAPLLISRRRQPWRQTLAVNLGDRDNRRSFLKSAAAAGGAAALASSPPPGRPTSPKTSRRACRSVTLGKTGQKVSVLGMGTSWDVAPAFVQAALFAGVRYIDTSETYENGNAERDPRRSSRTHQDAQRRLPGHQEQPVQGRRPRRLRGLRETA